MLSLISSFGISAAFEIWEGSLIFSLNEDNFTILDGSNPFKVLSVKLTFLPGFVDTTGFYSMPGVKLCICLKIGTWGTVFSGSKTLFCEYNKRGF